MSYSLILVRVPAGASDEEIEKAGKAATEEESKRPPGPADPAAEERKRALAHALLEECPELEGGEPDYAAIAKGLDITVEEARQRHRYWQVVGPEEGAGIDITIHDSFVHLDMAAGGTDEDWEDVWRYLEILVRDGGFVVWDPQGPNVVDLAAGPRGDGKRLARPKRAKRRTQDAEPEDVRRGGAVAALINSIVDEAIAPQLAAAGFKRAGRTWRKYLDDGVVQVVNIQWSPRRDSEGWFTLNAGVYIPELAKLVAEFQVTTTPKEYDCHLRKRPLPPGVGGWEVRVPGMAKNDPALGDGWFSRFFSWLDQRDDAKAPAKQERAARELRESLERYAFPWLERVSSLRGARDELLRSHPSWLAAQASLLLGERDEAKRILERELARANPEYAETLRKWGREHGLIT
jgi:hypothetical protein